MSLNGLYDKLYTELAKSLSPLSRTQTDIVQLRAQEGREVSIKQHRLLLSHLITPRGKIVFWKIVSSQCQTTKCLIQFTIIHEASSVRERVLSVPNKARAE